jgi:hypothetical protein
MSSNAIEKITEKSSIKNDNSLIEDDDDEDENNNEVNGTNNSSKIHISIFTLIIAFMIHQHFVH